MDSSANITWDQYWWFQFWCLSANIWWRWRWLRVSLGHWSGCYEIYPAATRHIWTVRTKTRPPVRLISSSPILNAERKLFHLMIRRRAWPSFSVVVFNRYPHSLWVRLLFSLTRLRVFRWPNWHSSNSQHLPLRKTRNCETNTICKNYGSDMGWHDCHFEVLIRIQWWMTAECDQQKCASPPSPRKKAARGTTKWWSTMKVYQRIAEGL